MVTINWTTISQSLLTAVLNLAVIAAVMFFANRFKFSFKSDDRIVALEKDAKRNRKEHRAILMSLSVLLDCYTGKQPNGELEAAKKELNTVIFGTTNDS